MSRGLAVFVRLGPTSVPQSVPIQSPGLGICFGDPSVYGLCAHNLSPSPASQAVLQKMNERVRPDALNAA